MAGAADRVGPAMIKKGGIFFPWAEIQCEFEVRSRVFKVTEAGATTHKGVAQRGVVIYGQEENRFDVALATGGVIELRAVSELDMLEWMEVLNRAESEERQLDGGLDLLGAEGAPVSTGLAGDPEVAIAALADAFERSDLLEVLEDRSQNGDARSEVFEDDEVENNLGGVPTPRHSQECGVLGGAGLPGDAAMANVALAKVIKFIREDSKMAVAVSDLFVKQARLERAQGLTKTSGQSQGVPIPQLIESFNTLGIEFTREEASAFGRRFEANGDGRLSFDEFTEVIALAAQSESEEPCADPPPAGPHDTPGAPASAPGQAAGPSAAESAMFKVCRYIQSDKAHAKALSSIFVKAEKARRAADPPGLPIKALDDEFKRLGVGLTDAEAKAFHDKFDTDGDGRMTLQEFAKVLAATKKE